MWELIKRLFGIRKKQAKIQHQSRPDTSGKITIGFVVGHNLKKQGAVNYQGKSEWEFSCEIYRAARRHISDRFNLVAIYRPMDSSYSGECISVAEQLYEIGADFSFHSHFNAYNKSVTGTETRYYSENPIKNKLHDELISRLGVKDRGMRKVSRGSKMLRGTHCPSMIFEWCFGDHKHDDADKVFNNNDLMGEILADSFDATFK